MSDSVVPPATRLEKRKASSNAEPARQESPEIHANIVSRIFFVWVVPFIYKGWKKPIQDEDLWELRDRERGRNTTGAIIRKWNETEGTDVRTANRLQHVIFSVFRRSIIFSGILKFIDVILYVIQPIFINELVSFLQSDKPIRVGIGWAFALFLTPLIKTITENNYFASTMRTGMRVRSGLQGILYDKSLRLSPTARASASLGEIVNLMQLDSQRIGDFVQFSHVFWSAPIQIIITVGLLYHFIEVSAIIGLVFTLLTLPVQGALFSKQIALRKSTLGITDKRVKLMNEILQGIKAVKFYAWEKPFSAAVKKLRLEELSKLYKVAWVKAAILTILMTLPALIGVITFTFYTSVFNKPLNPEGISTGIALLNQLRIPVMMLPMVFTSYIDARLGLKRIERLLDLEDTSNYSRSKPKESIPSNEVDGEVKSTSSDTFQGQGGLITISNGEFEWSQIARNPLKIEKKKKSKLGSCIPRRKKKSLPPRGSITSTNEEEKDKEEAEVLTASDGLPKYVSLHGSILQDINLRLEAGELYAIVGQVGSGKSSLLHAMLGEMRKVKGDVTMEGRVAYVAQTAWIFHDSLRNNITFGKEFDEELYEKSIKAAALEQDIESLPAGDETSIGEKGINLSGGQKQRVSIARAVYAEADVYLFDDPLSALDSHVSQHVFKSCISNNGVLSDKLRVLVTNQMQVLSECDSVVYLDSRMIIGQGPFAQLAQEVESFKKLVDEQQKALKETERSADMEKAMPEDVIVDNVAADINSVASLSKDHTSKEVTDQVNSALAGRTLLQDEERKTGKVGASAYLKYIKALGNSFLFFLLIVLFIVSTAMSLLVQWWLSFWAEEDSKGIDRSRAFYLGIYFAITLGYALLTFVRSIWLMSKAVTASKHLHSGMLASVLHAPLTFFDTTPIGRVLSRFSRDVSALDELLPQFFQQTLNTSLQLLVTYVFIGAVLPLFFAVAIPITIFYFFVMHVFNRTLLELKRLDSISKSPIYAHFSETLGGLSTLRAYDKQEQSRQINMTKIDTNQRAYFTWILSNRLFTMWLEIAGSLLVFATAIFGVFARNKTYAGNIGLALTYALQVTSFLGFAVRSITELEGQMSSMERADYYINQLPQEADTEIEGATPPKWPEHGEIEFKNLKMRYRPGLPLVLKGVSLNVKGGEKVGIVGRTGSGKSSLMIALLRMVELHSGQIYVDGVDLRSLGLDDVRSKITIIPQDPVMFSGTIRSNLDPFERFSDTELWWALDKSHLKSFVLSLDEGLDSSVSEYGENLSAGQRQIICLTRALLRDTKILVLDEASSSLDMETDRLIQETIRKYLKGVTILTIAHRLFTLADYDKIVVMDNGRVGETGTPTELLDRTRGEFKKLVDSLGPSGSAHFKRKVLASVNNPEIKNI